MSAPSLGALIWISTKPLIRLAASISFGYALAKLDLFGSMAARGAGQIVLNVTLPSLMISKLVPAFTPQNIVALGPLVFIALLYQAFGFIFAWLVRLIFWVPKTFRRGIIVAGVWNNWGDVPVAVLMSITSNAPFNPNTDEALAVAYIAPFILVFFVTFFPFGGSRLLNGDFRDPYMDDGEDDGIRERLRALRSKLKRRFFAFARLRFGLPSLNNAESEEKQNDLDGEPESSQAPSPPLEITEGCGRHVTFSVDQEGTTAVPHTMFSTTETTLNALEAGAFSDKETESPSAVTKSADHQRPRLLLHRGLAFLRSLVDPITISIIFSIVVAVIPTLKALFVTVDGVNIPNAPDGEPPLSFVMDIADFFGNASVPLGLICLGAALARMKVPRPISRAPLGAIISLAIAKVAILPVIAVLIVQALTYHTGMFPPENKVLRYVAIFLSTVPTATTQVYVTQVHSPDGEAKHVPAFLIPQYFLMIFSMVIVNAYMLHILF